MLDIDIRTIPHNEQRYPTVGDWQTPEEGFVGVTIVVSQMPDERYEFLVAIHELIEYFLAKRRGISAKDVTVFDIHFESNRPEMEAKGFIEPGDHPSCPVYHEHQIAGIVERLLAHELEVNWRSYDDYIESL